MSDTARLDSLCATHMKKYDEREEVYTSYMRHLDVLKEFSNGTEADYPTSTTAVYDKELLIPIAEIYEMSDVLKTILLSSAIQEGYYDTSTGMFVIRSTHHQPATICHGISPNLADWETIDFE